MNPRIDDSSTSPTCSVPRLCVLLAGLVVVGCGDADDPLARLDGRWRERYSGIVDEANTDDEVLGRDNVDEDWFELDLEGGRGYAINTHEDIFDGIPTRCVVRHPITFSRTAAGWTVVEEEGELVEFSGSDSLDCEGGKDFGIWTHGGLAQPLHRVEVIDNALLVESEVDSDGWVYTMVFTRQ